MEKEVVLETIIEKVVDDAMFDHKHTFKMYDYLVDNNLTKHDIQEFQKSGTAQNIRCTLDDLSLLIEGGHSDIKEAYPNWSKPEARKIREYLNKILSDAKQYEADKGKGRGSKQGYRGYVAERQEG